MLVEDPVSHDLVRAVYIGGISGAGKTSLVKYFHDNHKWQAIKQRQALLDAGREFGLGWPAVALCHHSFIEKAAEMVLKAMNGNTLVVDCHYAIETVKAYRPHSSDLKYICDLDRRFVQTLCFKTRPTFVLLDVVPEIARDRLLIRDGPNESNTVGALRLQRNAEQEYFVQLHSSFHEASVVTLEHQESRATSAVAAELLLSLDR